MKKRRCTTALLLALPLVFCGCDAGPTHTNGSSSIPSDATAVPAASNRDSQPSPTSESSASSMADLDTSVAGPGIGQLASPQDPAPPASPRSCSSPKVPVCRKGKMKCVEEGKEKPTDLPPEDCVCPCFTASDLAILVVSACTDSAGVLVRESGISDLALVRFFDHVCSYTHVSPPPPPSSSSSASGLNLFQEADCARLLRYDIEWRGLTCGP